METFFDGIAGAHSNLARKRVLADVRVLTRDTLDLVNATVCDLRKSGRQAGLHLSWNTLVRKHPYPCLGTALVLGVLAGVLVGRTGTSGTGRARR
jgi:hypothetical protein